MLFRSEEIKETFGQLTSTLGIAEFNFPGLRESREAFLYKAAQEKKFLLREEGTGREYFKLPLVKVQVEREIPEFVGDIQLVINEPTINVNFADAPEFQQLAASLDYKTFYR